MAAEMKNPRYKKQLEDMAEVWERLAHERRGGSSKANPIHLDDFRTNPGRFIALAAISRDQ
jgi:hypothetical protein